MSEFIVSYKRGNDHTMDYPVFLVISAENEYDAINQALSRVSENEKDYFHDFKITKKKGE